MLKSKFRKAEEQEMARIIGWELIQKCEDLRDEYKNFYEIYQDVTEESAASELNQIQANMMKSQSIFSLGGN